MYICILNNTVFQIIIGCVSSLIVWWLINIVLSPRLKIERDVQYPKENKKYIRVKNWTCFDAYEVRFRTEYRIKGNKLNSYTSTTLIPSIERRETYLLELASDNEYVKTFFSEQDEKSRLIVTAVFQSKFGVKRRKTQTIRLNKEKIM